MANKHKELTTESKYVIADAMAKDLKDSIAPAVLNGDRKVVFGIVINTTNASGKTLVDVFGEDDGVHITNLVIQRLTHKFESKTTSAF
jgi:hypothetical protein